MLQNELDNMNCDIAPRGGVKTSMSNVVKTPDCAWGPLKLDDYSTCVLEAGVSESSRGLARDAKIWLEHRESHVTQVVTVKISRTRPEMVFVVSKQGEEERETRAHHPTRAIVDQEIHITLDDGRSLADGQLCLSFEQLLERPPRPGTGEGDLVFSARELGGIARLAWVGKGFVAEQ